MRPRQITSPHNPQVKAWADLLTKKGRDKERRFLIEGVHLVQEALASRAPVETIIYDAEKGLPEAISNCAGEAYLDWVAASGAVLTKIADTKTPQGVCAIVRRADPGLDAAALAEAKLAVVIDGVQDPGNLGTIIRSADAAAADAVIVGSGSVDMYNPKTIRSTMGSLFHIPVIECDLDELFRLRKTLHAPDLQIVSTSLQAAKDCYELDLRRPTWIVIGNEANGVSPKVAANVDLQVKIPMPGKAESLNAAIAASVLLFETVRQRR
ncbi:MAG TPA: RNA methyltransferase [Bacilli bacterium]